MFCKITIMDKFNMIKTFWAPKVCIGETVSAIHKYFTDIKTIEIDFEVKI